MNAILKMAFAGVATAAGAMLYRRRLPGDSANVVGHYRGGTVLRTPEARFLDIPDYPFAPHYVTLDGLRVHYLDEGDPAAPVVLLLHGEPSWSYLYRKMIPLFTVSGYRAVAPDLVGFGKSDKPTRSDVYSYQQQIDWLWQWIEAVELNDITLLCHDWGSLLGLRIVAAHPERFARVVLTNGGLPTGDRPMPPIFKLWQTFSRLTPLMPVGSVVQLGTQRRLTMAEIRAYDAPFPSEKYKTAARGFPSLVPTKPSHPEAEANRRAWQALETFDKPFLTAFGAADPITRGGDRQFQRRVAGAQGQPHVRVEGAGHFIQEDRGEALAQIVIDLIRAGERS